MPANYKVWRPLAWCSFVMGRYEQARKYYDKLIEREPTHHDLISLGHLEWCEGKRNEAIECYRKSLAAGKIDFDEFLAIFDQDRDQLLKQGIDPEEMPILLDRLRYLS